jgi:hypothetical protein
MLPVLLLLEVLTVMQQGYCWWGRQHSLSRAQCFAAVFSDIWNLSRCPAMAFLQMLFLQITFLQHYRSH